MSRLADKIVYLDPAQWRDHRLDFEYTSDFYYDVQLSQDADSFAVTFVKTPFPQTVTHIDEGYDKLYLKHWENAEAYGIIEENSLIAAIEICPEEWSNRLRVTEMWVDRRYHRQGLGTALMNHAKAKAKEQGRRAVMLETQSCNANAIAFYLAQGFRLIGFDACCYSNRDVEQKEVRMEMGYFFGE